LRSKTRYYSPVNTSPFSALTTIQPQLDHERFAAHRELEALLKANLRGEVRFDLGSRALYAADSSNYRQLPVGVILPRDAEDVEAALAACRSTGAAVLPRGAGTSLAGQCANVAVVFDFSRYMNGLNSIDPLARLARVEPGIVLDRLREAAEVHHLTYAPDPATHSRCTLGGMIGNNSCGVHGLLGGKVADNVESMDLVLYDGTRMTVGRTSPLEMEATIRGGGRVGEIYAGLARLRDRYAGLIREKFPRIPRRVSGYNLDELLDENGFHVARALVGSEGTCATIVSATVNLAASPPYRVLTALAFSDAFLAADALKTFNCCRPAGAFCWRRWGRGTPRRRRPRRKPWYAPPEAGRPGPWPASIPLPRRRGCGRCASRRWAPRYLFPANPRAGKAGKTPAFLPRSLAPTCAS
jgi:FAD/FMN-containing dehydrogenase